MTIEDAIEKAARAHYEKYIESVRDLEEPWRSADIPESHWLRMYESMRAAIAAFLRAAVLSKDVIGAGFMAVDWLDTLDHINDVQKVFRAMSSRLADEIEGAKKLGGQR